MSGRSNETTTSVSLRIAVTPFRRDEGPIGSTGVKGAAGPTGAGAAWTMGGGTTMLGAVSGDAVVSGAALAIGAAACTVVDVSARLRMFDAATMPAATIATTIAAALPRSISRLKRSRAAARASCRQRKQTVVPGRRSWVQTSVACCGVARRASPRQSWGILTTHARPPQPASAVLRLLDRPLRLLAGL